MSLNDLSIKVSELMSAAYKDFVGCNIQPYAQGVGFDTRLYFSDAATGGNEGETFAFESNSNTVSSGSGLLSTLNVISQRTSATVYKITADGKKGLSKFIYNNMLDRDGNMLVNRCVGEEKVPNYGRTVTYATVYNVDLYKLLGEIYGTKDSNGSYLQYLVSLVRPESQAYGIPNGTNWLISLQRISMKELQKLGEKTGMMVSTNVIPMVGRQTR